ncbi:rhamnan synthesis F family protein [Lactococcus lactis]|uniref:Rhamnan synthesis F family protein n=1 Tax=Lactococcus lactis TaxID=1358 RepID=A0AAP5P647_9LACT|nr:rhamnan synthesis F family protein [Lactococcus lactis]MDT2858613.1 rhamnan synthesis F family protein [Lactococcus lactis]MDT2872568.1 rhamnan synthesis F family protein [Lactococcus lactis]MDT2879979.1 rhamnan synthesis F family protein [Lactococcus lactis]MDT2901896.1 rhamnan synthesis F family protein [Lactococcus lactis]MDT2907685.1 rhamnan synthesis F family protein [Lactococcus lactis]
MPTNLERMKYVLTKKPKLLVKAPGKILRKTRKHFHPLKSLQLQINKNKRKKTRRFNNYENPKRVLIYVIYENQPQLQSYKLFFLKALADLSDKVLIVLNSTLADTDVKKLEKFGQVISRENTGYDTAAFRHGILLLKDELSNFDELLLVNDTNVGPMTDLSVVFQKMSTQKLDFWGISYGEKQADFTGFNPYGAIHEHLQSYFLVIEKNMFQTPEFLKYWENLSDTNSRNKAIGKHETVFTKYFSDLGFIHGAVAGNNEDSAMYIHPLTMLKKFDVPLVKYTAFSNDTDDKFAWQGLERKTEVPDLINYIKSETKFPKEILDEVINTIKHTPHPEHILIIDGVENQIPQCTRYRVINKAEQLRSFGHEVWTVNASDFQMGYAEYASQIIIYRTPYSEQFKQLIELAHKYNKPVFYDIDDLVYDTSYTDQLDYVKTLGKQEKEAYDSGVRSYGRLMELCDAFITSTTDLKNELLKLGKPVYLNRNLASEELISISEQAIAKTIKDKKKIKIGYFSGSITHNENFDLIRSAILKILKEFPQTELHLVGHLTIPDEMKNYKKQLIVHDFLDWTLLPSLVADMDINLAPLVDNVFNRAKSEIKWLEAALVGVTTVASDIGSFSEIITNETTGVLVADGMWYEQLKDLIDNKTKLEFLGNNAKRKVISTYKTTKHKDEFIEAIHG